MSANLLRCRAASSAAARSRYRNATLRIPSLAAQASRASTNAAAVSASSARGPSGSALIVRVHQQGAGEDLVAVGVVPRVRGGRREPHNGSFTREHRMRIHAHVGRRMLEHHAADRESCLTGVNERKRAVGRRQAVERDFEPA